MPSSRIQKICSGLKSFINDRDLEWSRNSTFISQEEIAELERYESCIYTLPNNKASRRWVLKHRRDGSCVRWITMIVLGLIIGVLGFLMHQLMAVITDAKWYYAARSLSRNGRFEAWVVTVGYSLAFIIPSAALVVFLRPVAASSGLPELIASLNGTIIPKFFSYKTVIVKFFSCSFAVGSGIPAGPEGSLIHMGSAIASNLSHYSVDSLNFRPKFFERFRNPLDRRNLISAGAAAGIASAYMAPIGGLLLAFEDVSTFWSIHLMCQIFVCCAVSNFTTVLLGAAFPKFQYQHSFGYFNVKSAFVFQTSELFDVHIAILLPALVVGFFNGVLGSIFNYVSIKINRKRREFSARLQQYNLSKLYLFLEPALIIVVFSTLIVFLPGLFPCRDLPDPCLVKPDSDLCLNIDYIPYSQSKSVLHGLSMDTCGRSDVRRVNSSDGIPNEASYKGETYYAVGRFNEMSAISWDRTKKITSRLFSRNTNGQFGFVTLVLMLIVYFPLACWTNGASIASGLQDPCLFIGALTGRMMGLGFSYFFEDVEWIDEGVMALLGASAFYAGVSRLTISLIVIMLESTKDYKLLPAMIVTVIAARTIGNLFVESIYRALLKVKCIPYLPDRTPRIYYRDRKLDLRLFPVSDVVTSPVRCVRRVESVKNLVLLLRDTKHHLYPVVSPESENEVVDGTVTRAELVAILDQFITERFSGKQGSGPFVASVPYENLIPMFNESNESQERRIFHKLTPNNFGDRTIDIDNHVDRSPYVVREETNIKNTYNWFIRSARRHLLVTDEWGTLIGILTRRDLMKDFLMKKLLCVERTEEIEESFQV